MNAISEGFAQRLNASPDDTYSVMITLFPDAPRTAALTSADIQPVAGLRGIYKAQLPGHALLELQHDNAIQAIEPDDLDFQALR